ncbi:hypothetical protein SNEBB_007219 [Seison nebaliae]|nr:hypothetical protein SNEBB_007219 [Seison nebaliae]
MIKFPEVNESTTSQQIRGIFIDYFMEKQNHMYVHSSPLIPNDDPTLLFANAGMNQYKPIFLGTVDPKTVMSKYRRTVNSQKCIRAGGKHNDLDDVGKDVYHHTFFEMLGNWSFGDFFKKEAIAFAWELLTEIYKLDKSRLYVTYFGGNSKLNLEADDETKLIWEKYVEKDRILPFGMEDNFWEMGDTGPCGPCTEIHYDRIGSPDAVNKVNMDDPNVLEIWNLVFIQFNRESPTELKSLPSKHVDTGMGLERIASVIQNKTSNYDTDLFFPIMKEIEKLTKSPEYQGRIGEDDESGIDMAYRVVADHMRTLTMAITDGGRPDNVGRGYVLRRILRRAVRYLNDKLNGRPGILSKLVDIVSESLSSAFPEVLKNIDVIKEIIDDEERQFLKTLKRGQKLLKDELNKLTSTTSTTPTTNCEKRILAGEIVWKLYDTYGFPVDLTQIMCEEKRIDIDLDRYEECRKEAQLKSQQSSSSSSTMSNGKNLLPDVHELNDLKNEKNFKETDDSFKYNYKKLKENELNYQFNSINSRIIAIRSKDSFVDEISEEDNEASFILDHTIFYGEQGGQINDEGFILKLDMESEFMVTNVQLRGGYVIHVGKILKGKFCVNDHVQLNIDLERRRKIMSNHTATHVLNFALRSVLLNNDVDQKGSLVAPDRLRFDFSSKSALTSKQIRDVEDLVNENMKKSYEIYTKYVELEKAKEIVGLRAMFGETYPDPVRVVSVGKSIDELMANPKDKENFNYAIEFCGGTHLHNSEDIGNFVILNEEAIAKGIRRITAVSLIEGRRCMERNEEIQKIINNCTMKWKQMKLRDMKSLNDMKKEIIGCQTIVDNSLISYWLKLNLRNTLKTVRKEVDSVEKQLKTDELNKLIKDLKEDYSRKNSSNVFVKEIPHSLDTKSLNDCCKQLKSMRKDLNIVLISNDQLSNKCVAIASVEDGSKSKLKANNWLKCVSEKYGCRGGGKETSAQVSGKYIGEIDNCVNQLKQFAFASLEE